MESNLKPFFNIGPGEHIKEELDYRGWTQKDLSEVLDISLKEVNKLIKSKRAITIKTARLLSNALGPSPEFWLNLDTSYRLRLKSSQKKEENVKKRSVIYDHMPVNELIKKGWFEIYNDVKELTEQTKAFWKMKKLDLSFMEKDYNLCFKKSNAFEKYNKYHAIVWQQMALKCSEFYNINAVYEKNKLIELSNQMHAYTINEHGIDNFIKELNKIGIKFFVLEHLKNTYVDGASFFDKECPVIIYTKRHDRIDNFWFTIAHEIGHILHHFDDDKKRFIIDDFKEKNSSKEENEANLFASKILKHDEIISYTKALELITISKNDIKNISQKLKIEPSIVVGCLQHNGILPMNRLNNFKSKVNNLISEHYLVQNNISEITEQTMTLV